MLAKASALIALCLASFAAAAPSAGCGLSPPQSGTKRVQVNGQQREYILKVPSNYDSSKPHRLIVGYHWLSGSAQNVASGGYYGLESLAGGSAVFIAPQGLDAGWANTNDRDLAFTDKFVSDTLSQLCIDDDQIFATGFSYGGAMSFAVACARPDVFRAVAPIAGAQLSGCKGGNTPVPYLGIHGVSDSVLNISMGRQLRDKYLQLNGCQAKQAQEPNRGSGTHIKTEYSCAKGYPVWWIAHGGDHVGDPKDSNGQVWAPQETWTFFTQTVQS